MRIVCSLVAILVIAASAAAGAVAHRARSHPRHAPFAVSVAFGGSLRPGISRRLDLRLRNTHRFPLRITHLKIAVRVDRDHDHAGCDRLLDFHTIPMPRAAYPLRLPARSTRSLTRLGVSARRLPRLGMRNRRVAQNACQGAQPTLRFAGSATRWHGR